MIFFFFKFNGTINFELDRFEKKLVRVIFSDYCISFYYRVSILAIMSIIMSIERFVIFFIGLRVFLVV